MKTRELEFYELLRGASSVTPTADPVGSAMEKELEKTEEDFKTPVTLRNLFTHHDAHPVVLGLSLVKAFKTDWLFWEAETLWAEIQRTFKTQISEITRAKIQTVRALHVSVGPWESWQVFEKIIQGLNNNVPRWDVMQAPSLEQLYAGIDIIRTIRQETFAEEVKAYMASAVLLDEVTFVPPPLDFLQINVSQPSYHCLDCGNEDSALFHDGVCDTCTRKFDEENPLSMRPMQSLIDEGKGKNLKLNLKYDPTEVERRWSEVSSKKSAEVDLDPENAVDIQVAKLLVARDYMNIRRRQLSEQLLALKTWLGA